MTAVDADGDQMESHGSPFELLIPFDTDDPEFVRGIEVGMLHARLVHGGQSPVYGIVHATNAEMMLRLAEAHHVPVRADDLGDWLAVEFGAPVSSEWPGSASR